MSADHQRQTARQRERRGLEATKAAAELLAISREEGLAALGTTNRLLVLLVATWGPTATLGDLAVGAGIQPHTVKRHLAELVAAELLEVAAWTGLNTDKPWRWQLAERLRATPAELAQDGLTFPAAV